MPEVLTWASNNRDQASVDRPRNRSDPVPDAKQSKWNFLYRFALFRCPCHQLRVLCSLCVIRLILIFQDLTGCDLLFLPYLPNRSPSCCVMSTSSWSITCFCFYLSWATIRDLYLRHKISRHWVQNSPDVLKNHALGCCSKYIVIWGPFPRYRTMRGVVNISPLQIVPYLNCLMARPL